MTISEFTLVNMAKVVCGDVEYTPYMSGPEIVHFFNKFGFNEIYASGFPSRWKYTEEKLRELNGTGRLRKIIEETVDPRRYFNFAITPDYAARQINEILKFDNFELKKAGNFYKVVNVSGQIIQPETIDKINHDFINQQIEKCTNKIQEEDYHGAITNARSLVEAIFIEIIERNEKKDIKNDGSIENLWSKVKKIMRLEIDKETLPEFVFQILSGIDTAIKGLAGLSNNAGDRHAIKFRTKKHHAKLAVNLSMTIADFLIDSWNFQAIKKVNS